MPPGTVEIKEFADALSLNEAGPYIALVLSFVGVSVPIILQFIKSVAARAKFEQRVTELERRADDIENWRATETWRPHKRVKGHMGGVEKYAFKYVRDYVA